MEYAEDVSLKLVFLNRTECILVGVVESGEFAGAEFTITSGIEIKPEVAYNLRQRGAVKDGDPTTGHQDRAVVEREVDGARPKRKRSRDAEKP